MLELFLDEKIDVNKVEVYKQFENIDLWITFNTNTILIIEDKTSSVFHDDELKRYKNIAEDWCKENLESYKIKYVYYKTDDYNNQELDYVKKSAFKPIKREDVLPILEKYYNSAYSDFVRDYYLHLSSIETIGNEVFEKSFDEIKESKDNLMDYAKGFCNYFSSNLVAEWHFVNNPSNPFIAMFLDWYAWDYGEFFFQFENFDLKIKIFINELNIIDVSSIFDVSNIAWAKVYKAIKTQGYNISRPPKVEVGRAVTIGCIDESMWLAKDSEGKIDKEGTLEKLKSLDNVMKEIVSA